MVSYEQDIDVVRVMQPQRNDLGLAGFICSILGLFTATLLSPVGLILSLIALGRRPRGFAIAGTIIGLLGTCGGVILLFVAIAFGLGVLLAMFGLFIFTQSERIELTADMAKIATVVERYKDENRGIPPADLPASLDVSTLTDPWGNKYRYVLTEGEPGYDIISDGQDATAGTADDVSLHKLDKYWENAFEDFERELEELEERNEKRDDAAADSMSSQ